MSKLPNDIRAQEQEELDAIEDAENIDDEMGDEDDDSAEEPEEFEAGQW